MYSIGAVTSVLGAFGLIYKYFSKDEWNELLNTMLNNNELHNHFIFLLADFSPFILIIIGSALMLNARKEK